MTCSEIHGNKHSAIVGEGVFFDKYLRNHRCGWLWVIRSSGEFYTVVAEAFVITQPDGSYIHCNISFWTTAGVVGDGTDGVCSLFIFDEFVFR
jgi:hypothetical protein